MEFNLQMFGGRDGKSGTRAESGGISNKSGASTEAVAFLRQAMPTVDAGGMAAVVINESFARGREGARQAKAENPANKALESELRKLGEENGLMVNFQTKTRGSTKTDEVLNVTTKQTKQRIMYVWKP